MFCPWHKWVDFTIKCKVRWKILWQHDLYQHGKYWRNIFISLIYIQMCWFFTKLYYSMFGILHKFKTFLFWHKELLKISYILNIMVFCYEFLWNTLPVFLLKYHYRLGPTFILGIFHQVKLLVSCPYTYLRLTYCSWPWSCWRERKKEWKKEIPRIQNDESFLSFSAFVIKLGVRWISFRNNIKTQIA